MKFLEITTLLLSLPLVQLFLRSTSVFGDVQVARVRRLLPE